MGQRYTTAELASRLWITRNGQRLTLTARGKDNHASVALSTREAATVATTVEVLTGTEPGDSEPPNGPRHSAVVVNRASTPLVRGKRCLVAVAVNDGTDSVSVPLTEALARDFTVSVNQAVADAWIEQFDLKWEAT